MDVKCPSCFNITTVFSHAQSVVSCPSCSTVLCHPTGGKARLIDGTQYRRKGNMEDALRRVIYAELEANDGCLNSGNAFDFSEEGLRSQLKGSSYSSIIRQTMLLSSVSNPNEDVRFELTDAVDKLFALSLGENSSSCFQSLSSELESDIQNLIAPQISSNYEQLVSIFEGFEKNEIEKEGGKRVVGTRPPIPEKQQNQPVSRPLQNAQETPASNPTAKRGDFVTAGQMLGRPAPPPKSTGQAPVRKPLGLSKRVKAESSKSDEEALPINGEQIDSSNKNVEMDPRLKGIDPKLVETIKNEIIHTVDTVTWDQIAGLEHAKNTIKEIVIWPMLRPDIFTGLRGPPKGLLLFGPPGTGKTMIGKCIASQAKATFFSISASSLTSKWVGEGEKLVRALFSCARALQPSVIFIDEIDSLLTQRTDGEFEASRRIKTEFLVQFDGASTCNDDRILVIGATNRPQELDEAARRRLVKRLYIPLPETSARRSIVSSLLSCQKHCLQSADMDLICDRTEGYSGADMDNLCREAALGPIRGISDILSISAEQVRPISMEDFLSAMTQVRASVSNADLNLYLDWNSKFGSLAITRA